MTLADPNTALSNQAFDRIAGIALSDAGLAIPKSKKALVQSRIDRRLRGLNINSVDDYIALLMNPSSRQERKELISILTTNVSSFYRENHHFEFLTGDVFPRLKEKATQGKNLRIWSAGCSSGQEPYTIAMELLKYFNQSEIKNTLILATDIDSTILDKAKLGIYPASELDAIPKQYQSEFFQSREEQFQASDRLKSLVRFRELNLHGDWPMTGTFDAIFCRNVLIYFDDQHQQALWPRFHKALAPSGHLFLGHSERIHPVDTSGFKSIGATIYQKTT